MTEPTTTEPPATIPSMSRAEALRQKLGLNVQAGPTPLKHKRGAGYGVILLHTGDLEHHAITSKPYIVAKSGAYVPEAGSRFLVNQTIKAGSYLTIWVEGDPEPVTTRNPVGYGARMLRLLVGPVLPRGVDAGLDANPFPFSSKRLIAAVLLLAGLGIAAWLWVHRKKNGG